MKLQVICIYKYNIKQNLFNRCIYELSLCNCTLGWIGEDCSQKFELQIPFKISLKDDENQEKDINFGTDDLEDDVIKQDKDDDEDEKEDIKKIEKLEKKPEPKIVEPESEVVNPEYWLKQFIKGSKVKTKKKKKIKIEVPKQTVRHQIEVINDKQNHSHFIHTGMFGLGNTDDYVVQMNVQNVPKLLSKTNNCRQNCNFNGLCYQKICFCRQDFAGKFCEISEVSASNIGFQAQDATYIFIIVYLLSVILCTIIVKLQYDRSEKALDKNI